MKAKKLLLCVLLSLALVVTFIPTSSFAERDYSADWNFTPFSEIGGNAQAISVGQTKAVYDESIFKFEPTVSGNYMFYTSITNDPDAAPIVRLLDKDGVTVNFWVDSVYELGNNIKVRFHAEAGETYYLQASNLFEDKPAEYEVSLKKDALVTDVLFTPTDIHPVTDWCGLGDSYDDNDETNWSHPDFMPGDKITLYYDNNTSKEFVYKCNMDPWSPDRVEIHSGDFISKADDKEVLHGKVDLSYKDSVTKGKYKIGETRTMPIVFYFEDEYNRLVGDEYTGWDEDTRIIKTISMNITFAFWHPDEEMIKTPATPATCSRPGNTEYWHCKDCKKYYRDADGLYEITPNSWTIPAGHKWKHVKQAAGLMKNGSEYDQCTVCGAKQNSSVIPGWSKYYVKAPKTVAGKKSFTVKWGKQSKANLKKFNGYQIRYSTKKSMAKSKMVKAGKTAKLKKVSGLKGKTKYFVQVRTYTKKSGKTFYSKWSAKKSVKTK